MPEPLKNALSADFISALAKSFRKADPNFDAAGFQKAVLDKSWKEKELKARIRHVAATLGEFLPYDYRKQLTIVLQVAPAIRGLGSLIFPDFVETYGQHDCAASLDALEILTQYSTSEFAIRPFLVKYPSESLARVCKWAKHPNEHVRRLASEGIRPRLPWASPLPAFKKDPKPVLEIIELLKNDPSEYVRRSVANNLNDIAKDNPKLVLLTAKKWYGKSPETDKLVKHACRTLLKKGDADALKIFGFAKDTKATVMNLVSSKKKIRIGESLGFSFEVCNTARTAQQLRVEYVIYFVKSNGKHAKKVFQLSSKNFAPGKTLLKRNHSFKDFTTRKHYAGEHHLAVAVNGVEKKKMKFVVAR
jgi:3-methyladenine DNA glycosylase AlkC